MSPVPTSKTETAFGKRLRCNSTNYSAGANTAFSRLTLESALESSATSAIEEAGT